MFQTRRVESADPVYICSTQLHLAVLISIHTHGASYCTLLPLAYLLVIWIDCHSCHLLGMSFQGFEKLYILRITEL